MTGNGAGPALAPTADTRRRTRSRERRRSKAKHAELSDAFLRAKAEAENTRRRAEEEIAKARKFAVEAFAESLLPVKDSLEAAIAIPDATPEQLLEGVHATLRQLTSRARAQQGRRDQPGRRREVRPAPAPGDQRGAGRRRSPTPSSTVLQKGYLIADRVLRPALVTVAAPK